MQSERKKLGELNQNPIESSKLLSDTKYKVEHKFDEK
jgi:hypothetical protein